MKALFFGGQDLGAGAEITGRQPFGQGIDFFVRQQRKRVMLFEKFRDFFEFDTHAFCPPPEAV